MFGSQSDRSSEAMRAARMWLGLALATLVLAGVFALAVVVARMPPFDSYVTDPLFFKRCLVAHVNLALVTWFYSFFAALLFLLPSRDAVSPIARGSVYISGTGVAMLLLGAALPGSQPLLSNYIPTIDNRLFQIGQVTFFVGVLASLMDTRIFRSGGSGFELPEAARSGLRAAAFAFALATLTFAIAYFNQTADLAPDVYYELLVWGGGHVLQLVCTLAMVTLWLILLTQVLGQAPVSQGAARGLFLALILPWTLAPVLAMSGTWSSAYRSGFTQLMQWCIFPAVLVLLLLCTRSLLRAWRDGRLGAGSLLNYQLSAFLVSATLTLLGFGLGAAIRGSNTMVPAHYHASVGAVTVAFMAGTFMLLDAFGLPMNTNRLRRVAALQPFLYGAGMFVFSAGFGLAGVYGMGRKVYGAEQAARGLAETIGLGLMGIGGFISISGGLIFLGVVAIAWWRGSRMNRVRATEFPESSWRWHFGTQKRG